MTLILAAALAIRSWVAGDFLLFLYWAAVTLYWWKRRH